MLEQKSNEVKAFSYGISHDALRGLRAMIINMPLREDARPNCAPLGPALIAARLREYGAEVALVDLNAYRMRDPQKPNGRHLTLAEAVGLIHRTAHKHGEPHLIGLGGMITTLRWQRELVKELRREFHDAMIISGGGLATEFREGLFKWMPELDAIVHSEADDVILSVGLDALIRSRSRSMKTDHHTVYAGDRPANLDDLPMPAWDLLVKDVDEFPVLETYIRNQIWGIEANNSSATPFSMTRSLNTVSSRGCPYACSFCFRGAQGERLYGVRSSGNLCYEIEKIVHMHNLDFIGILDDNFMVRADRIRDMVPLLGEFCKKYNVRWGTHGRLDEAADLKLEGHSRPRVNDMADAGCVYIGFGAESASPKVLSAMNKGGFMLTNGTVKEGGYDLPRTMVEGYRKTIKAGLHGNCTWIMGYPEEDLQELQTSVAFIQWQKGLVQNPDAVNKRFFTATAYPGTELFRHPKVKARISEGFGISFDSAGNADCDAALLAYVESLDDADKVLIDLNGKPVYYGEMPLSLFEKVRGLIDAGDLDAVLAEKNRTVVKPILQEAHTP